MKSRASTSLAVDRLGERPSITLRGQAQQTLWQVTMASKSVERDWTAIGPKVEYFIFDRNKAYDSKRGKATRVSAKNIEEATRLQYDHWIAQGVIEDSLDEGPPRTHETPGNNGGSQVQPTQKLCTWEQELRPPMKDPVLGQVADAILTSDIWAALPP